MQLGTQLGVESQQSLQSTVRTRLRRCCRTAAVPACFRTSRGSNRNIRPQLL